MNATIKRLGSAAAIAIVGAWAASDRYNLHQRDAEILRAVNAARSIADEAMDAIRRGDERVDWIDHRLRQVENYK